MRALVILLCLVLVPARAEAWDPLQSAADKTGKLLDSVVAPTLDRTNHLLHDADHVLHDNLDRAGVLVNQVGATFSDVDRSIAARIVQVQGVIDHTRTGIDATIDHTFDRIDRTLGELDRDAEKLLDGADKLIQKVDRVISDKLKAIDEVLAKRIRDVQFAVSSSIQQADDVARARLDQLDELAGRRLGNIDVIATKQSLSLEGMIGRIAFMITLIGLFAFIAWRGFRELADALKVANEQALPKARTVMRHGGARFLPQLVLALGGVIGLKLVAEHLPRDAESRACQQITDHRLAFAAAVRSLDVIEARYHESQLEILVPGDIVRYRAELTKTEVLHSLFTRPGQLHSQRGLAALVADITALENMPRGDEPAAKKAGCGEPLTVAKPAKRDEPADPDVLIAKAYVLWQVGGTRDDEYEAVKLCASALRTGPSLLAPLARHYIAAFLARPYAGKASSAELTDLARLAAQPAAAGEIAEFARVIEFDRRILALDRASSAAYLDMVTAQADVQIALARGAGSSAASAARDARKAAAAQLVDAWRTFDAVLASSPALAGDPMVLSVFTLDDAVLTRARYYVAKPKADDLAPLLTDESGTSLTPLQRAQIAPLRVAWEHRYGALLGPSERDIVAYQETQRFAGFERRAQAFEKAYVDFLVAAHNGVAAAKLVVLAKLAATAASEMGLYRATPSGLITEAANILAIAHSHGADADGGTLATIDRNYQVRQLRLL